jgi:hypothetical protein
MPLPDELRLLLCLLLTSGVFVSAFRFVRRVTQRGISQSLCDALLILYLVEYLAVAGPGALRCLNLVAICIAAVAASIALWFAANRFEPPASDPLTLDHTLAIAAGLFAAGYLFAYLWDQRWMPPMATDSLVYQLSTPALWLRRGSLAIFPTWYWNPANSYAPQASTSAFVWFLAPMNCDVLARYAQAPVLLWLLVLCYRIGSELMDSLTFSPGIPGEDRGGGQFEKSAYSSSSPTPTLPRHTGGGGSSTPHRAVAAWVAAAAVLSRPLFSEALFAKDDLFVTAFTASVILSCSQSNLRDRLGPWRIGVALGMTLASKYTILLICPIFLFLMDAPIRAGWGKKQFVIPLLVAAALSAPWYLRNLLLTGDPLFPADVKLLGLRLFTGLFGTERDLQLRTLHGVRQMLAETYHSLPIALLALLALLWIGSCAAAAGRSILRDPLQRTCLLGSMLVLLLFFVASPHHEVRYLFPLIVIWFACAASAIYRWLPMYPLQVSAAILLAAVSTATSFKSTLIDSIAAQAFAALLFAAAGIALILLLAYLPKLRRPAALLAAVAGGLTIYVYWHAYLRLYRDGCVSHWSMGYPDEAPAWQFIRDELPPDANVAFANTQFTYPLYGFQFQRDIAYAPTRRGLHSFENFPRMGDDVPGDLIVQTMTRIMQENPDRQTWLENLQSMHARYLLVFQHGLTDDPPELRFARGDPSRFIPRFSDPNAFVFEIRQP